MDRARWRHLLLFLLGALATGCGHSPDYYRVRVGVPLEIVAPGLTVGITVEVGRHAERYARPKEEPKR